MTLTTGFDHDTVLREMVQTATPIERVLIAYDHLDVVLERAQAAMGAGRPQEVNESLKRAQSLLAFLSIALDHEHFEAASLADKVYLYCWRRLIVANTRLDIEALREVKHHVSTLGAAFRQAAGGLGAS